jgi:hypothetical protein
MNPDKTPLIVAIVAAAVVFALFLHYKNKKNAKNTLRKFTHLFTDPCGQAKALMLYRDGMKLFNRYLIFPAEFGCHNIHEFHAAAVRALMKYIIRAESSQQELLKLMASPEVGRTDSERQLMVSRESALSFEITTCKRDLETLEKEEPGYAPTMGEILSNVPRVDPSA